jgi:hypothetical protein
LGDVYDVHVHHKHVVIGRVVPTYRFTT